MQPQRLPRTPLGDETVDYCVSCQAIWFDAFESTQLTPGATLTLFDIIRKATPAAGRALPSRLPCPRCTEPLAVTHDLQRTTRFTYYRCAYGHGRFTPFVQFLREKDFIRPLSPAELARLKETIRVVQCSSCGAPVDLEIDTACPYCRAPIAILDPDAVTATVHALETAETRRTTVDVDALVDSMLDAHRNASAGQWQTHDGELGGSVGVDLVQLGLTAVAALLAR
jgi:transcription elongation factor Elf1